LELAVVINAWCYAFGQAGPVFRPDRLSLLCYIDKLSSVRTWLGCNRLRRIRLLRIGGLCWVRRLRLRRRVLARIITCSFRVRRRR